MLVLVLVRMLVLVHVLLLALLQAWASEPRSVLTLVMELVPV